MVDAAAIAEQLVSNKPTPAGALTRDVVPRAAGLYAWWHRGPMAPIALHRESGPTRCVDDTELELIYVGIGGNLSSRIVGNHLGKQTGSSTLRRALGAWLGQEQGWEREWRAERVQHNQPSESAITVWMKSHLFVTWATHPNPRDVEAEVIAILSPPLNYDHNRDHPNWPNLEQARATWRSWRP